MNARDRLGDRHGFDLGEQALDERLSARPARPGRSVHPVQELTDGDHADRPILVAYKSLDDLYASLLLDKEVGVDQEGQWLSGAPASRRIRRRSTANWSSTGGRERKISPRRCPGRSLIRGGVRTAISAPLRVI
jgi:hypothetical protein